MENQESFTRDKEGLEQVVNTHNWDKGKATKTDNKLQKRVPINIYRDSRYIYSFMK